MLKHCLNYIACVVSNGQILVLQLQRLEKSIPCTQDKQGKNQNGRARYKVIPVTGHCYCWLHQNLTTQPDWAVPTTFAAQSSHSSKKNTRIAWKKKSLLKCCPFSKQQVPHFGNPFLSIPTQNSIISKAHTTMSLTSWLYDAVPGAKLCAISDFTKYTHPFGFKTTFSSLISINFKKIYSFISYNI